MINLRNIIISVHQINPKLTRDQLFDFVMLNVKVGGFYTNVELAAIEYELAERLSNY